MPNKQKPVWNVYLRPNTLTKDNDRDCIADVYSHSPTQRNEDIAALITKERSEFRKETILNILNMRDKAVLDFIRDGLSVMDGVSQISPRVSGVWETENSSYDEKIHKRTVDMVATADLRNALDDITVKVIGAKETTAKITAITDTATGLTDGTEYKTMRRLSVNLPSQIIARVPKEVPAGAVTVIVRTKLTGSNKTLKEVREMIFKLPCTAKIQAPSPLG